MATTAVTVDEYLHTSYRPDCDYVDGEVLERNLGEKEHSLLQIWIGAWFFNHRREWNIIPLTEQRVQTSATRYRVPDIAIVLREDDFSRIVTQPPLLCIEISSPEDRLGRMTQKLDDYLRMGVENVWALDPETRQAWAYSAEGFATAGDDLFCRSRPEIYLPLKDLWAELD